MRRVAALALLLGAVAVAGCSSGATSSARPSVAATSASRAASASPTPAAASSVPWVCHPGPDDDACTTGLDALAVTSSGSTPEPFTPVAGARVDCFYVYPTVSRATGTNAPLQSEPAVVATVRAQAAPFGSACRVFAPLYRQVTLAALFSGKYFDSSVQQTAYDDVVTAWHTYLAENPGRPVVLVGHSQGAMLLGRLLSDDVAQHPDAEARVVSALLIGGSVSTPTGSDVADRTGGLPACRQPGQTRCLVAYSTFAGEPPSDALFGRAPAGRTVVCTDPGRLAGGSGTLDPLVPTKQLGPAGGLDEGLPAPAGSAAGFLAYPGGLRGDCEQRDGASWLQVAPASGSALPTSLLTAAAAQLSPQWGLHTVDVTVALGDLVEVVRRQAAAWPG